MCISVCVYIQGDNYRITLVWSWLCSVIDVSPLSLFFFVCFIKNCSKPSTCVVSHFGIESKEILKLSTTP